MAEIGKPDRIVRREREIEGTPTPSPSPVVPELEPAEK